MGAKQLREYMEVKGYANAADWVYREGIQRTNIVVNNDQRGATATPNYSGHS